MQYFLYRTVGLIVHFFFKIEGCSNSNWKGLNISLHFNQVKQLEIGESITAKINNVKRNLIRFQSKAAGFF